MRDWSFWTHSFYPCLCPEFLMALFRYFLKLILRQVIGVRWWGFFSSDGGTLRHYQFEISFRCRNSFLLGLKRYFLPAIAVCRLLWTIPSRDFFVLSVPQKCILNFFTNWGFPFLGLTLFFSSWFFSLCSVLSHLSLFLFLPTHLVSVSGSMNW